MEEFLARKTPKVIVSTSVESLSNLKAMSLEVGDIFSIPLLVVSDRMAIAAKEENFKKLEQCIEQLPGEQLQSIRLFFLEKKCYNEIAEMRLKMLENDYIETINKDNHNLSENESEKSERDIKIREGAEGYDNVEYQCLDDFVECFEDEINLPITNNCEEKSEILSEVNIEDFEFVKEQVKESQNNTIKIQNPGIL